MKRAPIVLLLVLGSAFAFGLLQLFRLRFESGDVYPAYSSLRSDPLGTMALFESLEQMPQLQVKRDFAAANRLPEDKHTTYLHLAGKTEDWRLLPAELFNEIEQFAYRGGRLVVTFFPETSRPFRLLNDRQDERPNRRSTRKKGKAPFESVSIKERWNLEIGYVRLQSDSDSASEMAGAMNQTDLPLPPEVEWHSAIVFTNKDETWRTIYARGSHPVVVERKFGSGTVVLAGDSYFLSNEAMRKERHAELLSWLIGPAKTIVFDEAHFGLVERAGVAGLMRKYRLGGLLAGLLLLAGLFVWRNSLSFAPAPPEPPQESYVAGKDAATGLVNLLRRNVSNRDLLKLCLAEWKKTQPEGDATEAKFARAQAIVEAEASRQASHGDPVNAYLQISQVVEQRGRPRHTYAK